MGTWWSRPSDAEVQALLSEVLRGKVKPEWSNPDAIMDVSKLCEECRSAGLGSLNLNLTIGIDATASNAIQGKKTFHGESLHAMKSKHGKNPYELSLELADKAIQMFKKSQALGAGSLKEVHAYIFGDLRARHNSVRVLKEPSCANIGQVLSEYRKVMPECVLHGPTSFAPLINTVAERIAASGSYEPHLLLIITDGQPSKEWDCLKMTYKAIENAAKTVPLSIVAVGVGDGPWDQLQEFDDGLPKRAFDNFQFLNFSKLQELNRSKESRRRDVEAVMLCGLLQELAAQVKAMKELGLLKPRPKKRKTSADEEGAQPQKKPRMTKNGSEPSSEDEMDLLALQRVLACHNLQPPGAASPAPSGVAP